MEITKFYRDLSDALLACENLRSAGIDASVAPVWYGGAWLYTDDADLSRQLLAVVRVA